MVRARSGLKSINEFGQSIFSKLQLYTISSLYVIYVMHLNTYVYMVQLGGFPGDANGKEPACQCRGYKRCGSIPGLGRSPGGGHSNPLQYSCLENPVDRGAG